MKFYETSTTKRIIIVRLDKEEEFMSSIEDIVKKMEIESGFLWGIGAFKNAILSFYDHKTKSYIDKEINEDSEVVSVMGNISYKYAENIPVIHVHASLATKEYGLIGGHLKKAIVAVTLEVVLIPIADKIERIYNQEFNLFLWKP